VITLPPWDGTGPSARADEPNGQHSRSLSGMSALSGTAPLPPSLVSASLLTWPLHHTLAGRAAVHGRLLPELVTRFGVGIGHRVTIQPM